MRVLSGFILGWTAITASNINLSGFPKIIGFLHAAVWTAATNAPVPENKTNENVELMFLVELWLMIQLF